MSEKSLRKQEMVSDEWRRLTPAVSVAPLLGPQGLGTTNCGRQHYHYSLICMLITFQKAVSTTDSMHVWSQRRSSIDTGSHSSRRLDSIPFPLCFLE